MAPVFIKQCAVRKQLEDCTWTEIAAMSESGGANGCWHIGDKKTITLSGEVNGAFEVQIADFDFYDKADGSGKAGIVFAFTKNIINDADASYGQRFNYGSTGKINMLGDELSIIKASLPSELKALIKTVKIRNANGTTGLLPGSGPHYGPRPNCVETTDADLFPPSYAEITNGGTFYRNCIATTSSSTQRELVKEGPALELYKYSMSDNLAGTPLDKGGSTFLRTVYSTFSGYYPGYIYIKGYSINAEGKIVTLDCSLSQDFYGDENVTGTGATMGLCPMFCV